MSERPTPFEPGREPEVPPAPTPLAPPPAPSRSHALLEPRWLLPTLILVACVVVIGVLRLTAPKPERMPRVSQAPLVEVARYAPQTLRLTVVAHGTVAPRTESDLVAEVRGRIVGVAPALEAGGFFAAGDELLRLDGREHRIAVDRAAAALKLAESESRLADAELRRRRTLVERGVTSDADLDQFRNRAAVAAATLDQARANLAQARLDLERTILRAPFDGRVRERVVDLGQFVSPGTPVARIYAVDYAEVRLPVRTDELGFLELPAPGSEAPGAPVTLEAELGGRALTWPARLARTEGAIDLRTRMMNVVARVEDPHGRAGEQPPLPAGLFVRAEIQGRELEDIFVLPARALRDGNRIFVVDAEGRLRIRDVSLARRGRDEVLVTAGLAADDRVIISPLRTVTDGMAVRVRGEEAP